MFIAALQGGKYPGAHDDGSDDGDTSDDADIDQGAAFDADDECIIPLHLALADAVRSSANPQPTASVQPLPLIHQPLVCIVLTST